MKYPLSPPDGVDLVDEETNEEIFFESVDLVCQALNVEKHHVYVVAKKNKLLKDKYKVKLFRIKENIGPTMG